MRMENIKINNINNNYNNENLKIKSNEYATSFISVMLNIMFENVKFDPFSKKDSIFKSELVNKYAEYIAPSTNVPDIIMKSLIKLQESNNE